MASGGEGSGLCQQTERIWHEFLLRQNPALLLGWSKFINIFWCKQATSTGVFMFAVNHIHFPLTRMTLLRLRTES